MRFHPVKHTSKKQLLKIWSPILLLVFVLCFLNADILKRSIVDVNMRSSYTSLLDTKFKFIEFFSTPSQREKLVIQMSPSKYVQFQKERAKKTKDFILHEIEKPFVFNYYKAKARLGNTTSDSKIKLFGLYPDHFGDSDGHSFRIKYNGKEGFGKKKVNVLKPIARSFNLDRMINMMYRNSFSGLEISSNPVDVIFNKKDYGIYVIEDFFDKYLIEENFNRESFIFEIIDKEVYFNHAPKDEKFINQKNRIIELVSAQDSEAFIASINKDKLFGFLALTLILNNNHQALDINTHWYYNPVINKFEPTLRETKITKAENNLNEDQFRSEISSILANRNQILSDWMSTIDDEEFIKGINKALFKIRHTFEGTLKDSVYIDYKQKLIGFKSYMTKKENLFRSNFIRIKLNDYQETNPTLELVTISKDTILDSDLIISKHQELIIEKGVTMSFINNSNLLVLGGKIKVNGTTQNPIHFKASVNSKSSIYINSDAHININNASFTNLSGLKKDVWELPSAVTLFETNATFKNCTFSGNLNSDDMVNTFRCQNVVFDNCEFYNILSDAIDSDFSNITVSNSNFTTIGNDGVDGSGSIVSINYCVFNGIEDKAISAGENSIFKSNNNTILNSELGLVCKDGSVLTSNKDQLKNNTIDLVLFKKKPIYTTPSIELINTEINSNLIEKESKITGLKNPTYAKNINKKLYGNDYGKATE